MKTGDFVRARADINGPLGRIVFLTSVGVAVVAFEFTQNTTLYESDWKKAIEYPASVQLWPIYNLEVVDVEHFYKRSQEST